MSDWIVGAVLLAAVTAAIVSIVKEKKNGKSCGSCGACPYSGSCGKKNADQI